MNPTAVLRYLSQSPMRTAAIGAGVGAAGSALQRNEDGSRGSLLRGAVRGAAVGGLLGGAGRAVRDAQLLNPGASLGQATVAAAKNVGRGVANFGKRQIHGATGLYDAEQIGMHGVVRSQKKVDLLARRLADDVKHTPGQASQLQQAFHSSRDAIMKEGLQAQKLRDAGLTNVPAAVRALRDPQMRGKALRAMGSTLSGGGGARGLAIGVGLPVALQAPSLMRGDESAQGGATMKQKLLGLGGSMAATAAVGGLPIVPQMIVGGALDSGVQKLVQPRKVTP